MLSCQCAIADVGRLGKCKTEARRYLGYSCKPPKIAIIEMDLFTTDTYQKLMSFLAQTVSLPSMPEAG